MTGPDPIRDVIATMFHDLDVAKSRGGYTLVDPHSGTPLARLKPIPQSDRFELFYWSDMRGRWRTFSTTSTWQDLAAVTRRWTLTAVARSPA